MFCSLFTGLHQLEMIQPRHRVSAPPCGGARASFGFPLFEVSSSLFPSSRAKDLKTLPRYFMSPRCRRNSDSVLQSRKTCVTLDRERTAMGPLGSVYSLVTLRFKLGFVSISSTDIPDVPTLN